jgi:hypothetical protein
MVAESPFASEWRKCLREHYKYVIRNADAVTQVTLPSVLDEAGFRDDDLRGIEREATMHVDDAPADFVPGPHPAECTCTLCTEQGQALLQAGHDEAGQPLSAEQLAEQAERDAAEQADDDPKQLSLF